MCPASPLRLGHSPVCAPGSGHEDRARQRAGAGAASLVAVAFTLAAARDAVAPDRGLLIALAIAGVALAWISVHTVWMLRYARVNYSPPTFAAPPFITRCCRISSGR